MRNEVDSQMIILRSILFQPLHQFQQVSVAVTVAVWTIGRFSSELNLDDPLGEWWVVSGEVDCQMIILRRKQFQLFQLFSKNLSRSRSGQVRA